MYILYIKIDLIYTLRYNALHKRITDATKIPNSGQILLRLRTRTRPRTTRGRFFFLSFL